MFIERAIIGCVELGRLPVLMDYVSSLVTELTIAPVLEEGIAFGGFDTPNPVYSVAGWEIRFPISPEVTATYRGKTLDEAVAAALDDRQAWL